MSYNNGNPTPIHPKIQKVHSLQREEAHSLACFVVLCYLRGRGSFLPGMIIREPTNHVFLCTFPYLINSS